ncbi:MAG TPA: 50S ribosomal protein L25/general stress protein Ctc [Gammaproteobacteria bacterium]|jgi:large subunit ribosomal protein L25|nr:50S ribosomal protein L25/general stress protein Ctc [Gammaproteobacteria bacterium]
MSAKNLFEIEASVRPVAEIGKGASRRLRCKEKVPAIVYGGGKTNIAITLEHKHIAKSLENEAFYSRILTLKTNGNESERVVLKDVQRHPYKARVLHVDFQRVRSDEKLHMHIPLHFRNGELAPGVKDAGGLMSHIMSDVEISCFPDDLPEFLEIDVSEMQLNQILHLSDIKLPKGVEIVSLAHGQDKPIVSVHMPRIEEEPVVEETAAPEASEVPAIAQKSDNEEAADTEGKDKK